MAVIHSSVHELTRKFPKHKDAIKHLAKSDDLFLTLCEDYINCKKALSYWADSKSELANIRSAEYISLLQELENEILQKLDPDTR